MPSRGEHWFLVVVLIAMLSLTSLPYFYAEQSSGPGYYFGGFLLNPLDGNSYLAKMQLGWRGEWRFHLLYTADTSEGAYLFLFYILLGHIARWLGLSLIFTFHLARLLASCWMVWILYNFLNAYMTGVRFRRFALLFVVFGSGLGWMALPLGGFTADFWLAEAFPFLSAYANPHFPLAIGLLLYLLLPSVPSGSASTHKVSPGNWGTILAGIVLASLAPFGVILSGLIFLISALIKSGTERGEFFIKLLLLGVGAGPVIAYTLWATHTDPVLSGWNAQNITPTPEWGNMLLAFSPAFIFALVSILISLVRRPRTVSVSMMWVIMAIILVYIPWSLQRRFALGAYVPLCLLAADFFANRLQNVRWGRFLAIFVLLISLPTNLIILIATQQAIVKHDETIYLHRTEAEALEWINGNTEIQAVILAAPETGIFIPARTGRRVVYGHPYETVDAEIKKQAVEQYFQGKQDAASMVAYHASDYIFFGPRERTLGKPASIQGLEIVYQNSDVAIYRRPR